MKNRILIVLAALAMFTGCGSSNYEINKKSDISTNGKTNSEFIDLTYKEYKEKIDKKENFVLLIWSTTCSHCETFDPKLNKIIKDYNLTIYGIDISKLTEEEYEVLKGKTFVSGTPTLVYIKDGVKEESLVGDKNEDAVIDFLVKIKYLEEK